jgi:tetratricopeptide (TPR) repeat protein
VSHDGLKRIAASNVPDSEVLFTLGLLAKRSGAYSNALTYYRKALKADAGFSECMNNLGNVYLLMKGRQAGAVEKARSWYNKAIKTNPTRAEFYYNLSKSYPLLQAESMQYVVKSRDFNPELIDRLTKITSMSPNQILVDCPIPQSRLWERAFKKSGTSNNVFLLVWRFFLHAPYDNIFAVPVALILIILLFMIFQKKVKLAVPCARCGQLFFRPINVHYSRGFCHQCQVIQQKGTRADPEIVRDKNRQIARYRRHRKVLKLIMGIFPVGGALVLDNRPVLAFGESLLFYFLIGFYLVIQHILPGTALLFCCETENGMVYLLLAGVLYVVSFGIVLIGFFRGEK